MRGRIGYLHVPKTAGTSITRALVNSVGSAVSEDGRSITICPAVMDTSLFGSFDRFDSLADAQRAMVFRDRPERLDAFDVVMGHFNAQTLLNGRTMADIAALLREPRARLVSLYTFWRSWTEAEHAGWGDYRASSYAATESWAAFLRDTRLAPQVDNVAARLLLGPHPLVPVDAFIPAANIDQVTQDSLGALAQLGFVDVVENGADCWDRLGTWAQVDIDVGVVNRTRPEPPPAAVWAGACEPAALEALRRRTEIDHELWVAAASRHTKTTDDLAARAAKIAETKFRSVGLELPPRRESNRPTGRWRRWTPSARRRR